MPGWACAAGPATRPGTLSAAGGIVRLARAKAATGMPTLAGRARLVDQMLAREVPGMHASTHPLTVRGQYAMIYRLASRATHGSIISLDQRHVAPAAGRRFVVDRPGHEKHDTTAYGLVPPIFATALLVAAGRSFNWLDDGEIRAINDRAVAAWNRTR